MQYTKTSVIERFNAHEGMDIIAFREHAADLEKMTADCLSQLYGSPIDLYDHQYRSAEQYMMAQKAALFVDRETWRKIMKAEDPEEFKALGDDIKKFDHARWNQEKYRIVLTGNLAKFSQNPELLDFLLSTGESVLVECSADDGIWGVRLSPDDPGIRDPNKWQGENLLGFALMEVRDILREWEDFHWDEIDWSIFTDCYHKDGDDPDYTDYDSVGFIIKDDKWGLIRSDGSRIGRKDLIVFYPQWDECEDLGSGYTHDVPVETVGYYTDYYFTRPAGGYSRSRLKNAVYFVRVRMGEKYGVVDSAGRTVTPCKWDEIDQFGNARQGEKWGFVNLMTCEETAPQWSENQNLDPYKVVWTADEISNWFGMFGPGSADKKLQWESTMVIFDAGPGE